MFSVSRALLTTICLAAILGSGTAVFAQATTGIDTNQSSLPFSINGKTWMTLTTSGIAFTADATITAAGVNNIQSGAGTAIYIGATPYLTVNVGAIGVNGVLTIIGTNAALNVSGPGTMTTLSVGGSDFLTGADAETLWNLRHLGACTTSTSATTQANALAISSVSATGALNFSCEAIADITGVGKTTVPTCATGNALLFDGTKFQCSPLPAPPSCTTAGTVYQGVDSNGNAICVSNLAPSCPSGTVYQTMSSGKSVCVTPSCSSGQAYQGLDSKGNPICVAMPDCASGQVAVSNGSGGFTCPTYSNGDATPLKVQYVAAIGAAAHDKYIALTIQAAPVLFADAGECNWGSNSNSSITNWPTTSTSDAQNKTYLNNQDCQYAVCAGYLLDKAGYTSSSKTVPSTPTVISTYPGGNCTAGVKAAVCAGYEYGGPGKPLSTVEYPPMQAVNCIITGP